jgi:hypothetical protein
LWGVSFKIGLASDGQTLKRGNIAPCLGPDMSVSGKHPGTDVARKLADRLLGDFRIFGKARDERVSRIVEAAIDFRPITRRIPGGLIAVDAHRPVEVDTPNVRVALIAG